MSWYGITTTTEFLVQLLLLAALFFGFAKFFNPTKLRLRFNSRRRLLRRQDPLFKFGLLGSALILLTVLFVYGFEHCDEKDHCVSKLVRFVSSSPNEIGDALAGVASALAFLWIILTVMMQSKELKAQRSELQLTRTEHQLQRKISQKSLNTLVQDSRLRDQQEAQRRFEAKLYEFLYAVHWHREKRLFCKWLFDAEGESPTGKTNIELIEQALDLNFKIRARSNRIDRDKPWNGKASIIRWNDLISILKDLISMEESLPESGKTLLEISRLKSTEIFLRDVSDNPQKWSGRDDWETK